MEVNNADMAVLEYGCGEFICMCEEKTSWEIRDGLLIHYGFPALTAYVEESNTPFYARALAKKWVAPLM